jgi:hypothetical protein
MSDSCHVRFGNQNVAITSSTFYLSLYSAYQHFFIPFHLSQPTESAGLLPKRIQPNERKVLAKYAYDKAEPGDLDLVKVSLHLSVIYIVLNFWSA